MHFELPDCRRCCLCLPLRHGILIFGYLNLMFALFMISLELWLWVGTIGEPKHTLFVYRGVQMFTQIWFCYFVYILEIIFNIVLLVGAHRKNTRLIRIYYYYGIVTTLASFVTYIFLIDMSWSTIILDPYQHIRLCLVFSALVLQCYLLLLIRSELKKLQCQGGQFRYVNHAAEILADPLPQREEKEGGQAV